MRFTAPLALISVLCFSSVSAAAQDPTIVRIGVILPSSASYDAPTSEARDRLMKALSRQKIDTKPNLSLQAVALDAPRGNKAIAEALQKNCHFVLYIQLFAVEHSYRFEAPDQNPTGNVAVATATAEYQLRRASDGVSYSIGIAKSDPLLTERAAIFQAVERIGGKVMGDLKNGGSVALGALPSTEQVPLKQGEHYAGSDLCAWLPANIPHAEALHGVCEYAIALPRDMPNFICQQETSRYRGRNRLPIDLITATVRYQDGNESYSDLRVNGGPATDAEAKAAGLWSSGQFQGNLRAIFHSRNHAVFEFSGENKIGLHTAWVFTYLISRQNEPLWELRGHDQVAAPPYGGELWIDQKTGALLRFQSAAKELPASFPMQSAEIVIDYDNVAFGDGTAFVLPVESTVATKYQGMESTRNVVQFSSCHRFHAKARMVMNLPPGAGGGESAGASSVTSSRESLERETERDEEIYAILREQAVREDDARLEAEQKSDLDLAAVGVIWKMAALEKERQRELTQQEVASSASTPNLSEPPANDNPTTTLRVRVNLVQVSVVLRDSKGHAVGNVRREDFHLLDDRRAQVITEFSVEKSGTAGNEPGSSPGPNNGPAVTLVENPKPAVSERDVAYLFDDVHSAPHDLAAAKDAAGKHIAELNPVDRVAIVSISGAVQVDFTADRGRLLQALHSLKPHAVIDSSDCPAVSYYLADLMVNHNDEGAVDLATEEAMGCTPSGILKASGDHPEVEREMAKRRATEKAFAILSAGHQETRQALRVFRDVIRRTASMPGQRSVVLVSPGFLALDPDAQQNLTDIIDQAIRSNIVINTLDPQGLTTGGIDIKSGHTSDPALKLQFDTREANALGEVLSEVASGTGGTFFQHNNDLDEGFRRTADAPEYIYVLGFSPQKLDGKFHKLKVTLGSGEKLTVQARLGYYAIKPASAQ
jgi:VWFA-related protein